MSSSRSPCIRRSQRSLYRGGRFRRALARSSLRSGAMGQYGASGTGNTDPCFNSTEPFGTQCLREEKNRDFSAATMRPRVANRILFLLSGEHQRSPSGVSQRRQAKIDNCCTQTDTVYGSQRRQHILA